MELIKFFDHCKVCGVFLLGDDVRFICELCSPYPYQDVRKTLHKYILIWRETLENHPVEREKENKGRAAANRWLREQLVG